MLTFPIEKQTSAQQGKIMSGEDKCMTDNIDLLGNSPLPWSAYKDCAEHLGSYFSRTSHSFSFSMYSLHLLLRASPAALLLILCLQLGTTKAQEDTWAKTFSSLLKTKKNWVGRGLLHSYSRNLHIRSWKLFQLPRTLVPGTLVNPRPSSIFPPLRECHQFPSHFHWVLLGCPWK